MNSGSVLSFQVSTTCGLRPNARQIRETDDCDRPVSAAIDRVDQWLSCPRPFSVSVRVTSTSTCSSVIFRAAPGRGASPRPSSRRSRNRTRHLRTDSRDSPVLAATRVSGATRPRPRRPARPGPARPATATPSASATKPPATRAQHQTEPAESASGSAQARPTTRKASKTQDTRRLCGRGVDGARWSCDVAIARSFWVMSACR